MSDDDGKRLLDELLEIGPEDNPGPALALGQAHWEEIRSRGAITRYDAESCRLFAIAAAGAEQYGLGDVWRARALARFAALGWLDGVASIISSQALARLARDNDDYPHGRTLDGIKESSAAFEILRSIEPLSDLAEDAIPEPALSAWSPAPDLTQRLFWEKGGFLQLILRRFDDARADYARAARVARPGRGELKVAGGALLVEYLARRAGEPALALDAILEQQRDLVGRMREAGASRDILASAEHNLEVMERGGEDLMPYEFL